MKKAILVCGVGLTLAFAGQAVADGCCQCWNDPPAEEYTCSRVDDVAACEVAGATWDHCTFAQDCWCADDGVCGGPHKMHFPQWPDHTGWDVNATSPIVLADDWQCTERGFVTDIHFWGSWKDGIVGEVTSFTLSIHADLPVGHPENPNPYSMPGEELWSYEAEAPDGFIVELAEPDSGELEGWYNPMTALVVADNHTEYYQYHVRIPEPGAWYVQQEGTIYWLNVSAHVVDPVTTQWGWKSSKFHWNDDGVWGEDPTYAWVDLFEPPGFTQSMDLAFVITSWSPIPAVSEWGLVVMALIGLVAGTVMFRRLAGRRGTAGVA